MIADIVVRGISGVASIVANPGGVKWYDNNNDNYIAT